MNAFHIYTGPSLVESQSAVTTDRANNQCIHPSFCYNYTIKMAVNCKIVVALAFLTVLVKAQRPFYAGLSPIGIPAVESDFLSNRFGEDEPAPIEVKGDRNLVNRLNALPVDKQPFWYLNWKAYEALRKRPQTYPQRPSPFNNN